MNIQNAKIGIIEFGCVGRPLAVELGKQRPVLGLDVEAPRTAALKAGHDGNANLFCCYSAERIAADVSLELGPARILRISAQFSAEPCGCTG